MEARRDEEALAAQRATSRWGVMAAPTWWALVLSLSVPAVLLTGIGVAFPTKQIPGGTIETVYLPAGLITGALAILLVGVMFLARAAVRRTYAGEVGWVDSLPFALQGHQKLLAAGRGRFKLVFQDAGPDRGTLEPLLRGVTGARLELDERPGPIAVEITLDCADGSGHARWRAWRSVVDQLILPLHRSYPLAAVAFA
ncbi:MAG TPA: hypothetical protein VMZ28_31105 [Kofleriaceae bacterium]|nr:hypothetical protein [Kofleriaceae bacterium]